MSAVSGTTPKPTPPVYSPAGRFVNVARNFTTHVDALLVKPHPSAPKPLPVPKASR